MGFIKYCMNYRENIKELEELTQKYDSERSDVYKTMELLKETKEKNKFLVERNEKHMETIKDKNKKIRELKKQNKFLTERENKLQEIETMFKNKRVLLRDLKELVENDRDDN